MGIATHDQGNTVIVDNFKGVSSDPRLQQTPPQEYKQEGLSLLIPSNKKNLSKEVLASLSSLSYALPSMISSYHTSHHSKTRQHRRGVKGKLNLVSTTVPPVDGQNWSILSQALPRTVMSSDLNNKPYNVVQESALGTVLTTSTSVPTFGAVAFTLTLLDQLTNFTNLFDQYRFNWIEVWTEPIAQVGNTGTSYTTVIDYDDATNLTQYAQALDYTNAVTTTLGSGHHRTFVPHIAVAAYSGAFTSFANEVAPWIDCSSSAVAHYGIKIAAQTALASTPIIMFTRLSVSFRNVR